MSLLGTQVYANPATPLWVSASGDIINGDLAVTGEVTAGTGVITNESPTGAGFVVQNSALAQVTRLTHRTGPLAGTFLQTNDPLIFTQIGVGNGNTNLTLSAYNPGAPNDALNVGGAINAYGNNGFSVYDASSPPVRKIAILNQAGQSGIQSDDVLYFSRIGVPAQSSLAMGVAPAPDVLTIGGTVAAKALDLEDTGAAPVVGSGKLTAGVATINTTAADVTCYILLTHTNLNATTAVGTLRVVNKIANSFTVNSVNALGAIEVGDDSDFDWLIVNPA